MSFLPRKFLPSKPLVSFKRPDQTMSDVRPQLRTALVTGGAQRIGCAIAKALAAHGYAVAIHCHRSHIEADALATTIRATGGRARVIVADLADLGTLAGVVSEAHDTLGPLGLLVNNASRFDPDEADALNPELWDQHFAINLRAPVFLSQALLHQLPDGQVGAIVNIVDQRVLKLTPQFFSYTLSKSALWTATQTMAQAFAPRLRVNAIGPGPTLPNARQSQEDFLRQSSAIPLRRPASPQAIAEAVLYLASAECVTGQLLLVDSGQHLVWQTTDITGMSE
jgi:NAD(P)-dependent dehydrogenase (short-subunit alcohol dehydrogenase family)